MKASPMAPPTNPVRELFPAGGRPLTVSDIPGKLVYSGERSAGKARRRVVGGMEGGDRSDGVSDVGLQD